MMLSPPVRNGVMKTKKMSYMKMATIKSVAIFMEFSFNIDIVTKQKQIPKKSIESQKNGLVSGRYLVTPNQIHIAAQMYAGS
mmetsp:Transcript_52426/g.126911  ORF Transcript_52426/g.126911 Transcript_52426/m.126911 type:complete len:82 (+) Transcript_52426:1224-1469(+)